MEVGCSMCALTFTNSKGEPLAVFSVRFWLIWVPQRGVHMMYFNSYENLNAVLAFFEVGTTISVGWTPPWTVYPFTFPGRDDPVDPQPTLTVDHGSVTEHWLCQYPHHVMYHPREGNVRCRIQAPAELRTGCKMCPLTLKNSRGDSFEVFSVRLWAIWVPQLDVYMMYFNTYA